MILLAADVQNFGSYKWLNFDFRSKGLTLLHGPTGAGKSTLQDIVPWILFGVTAKNGKVDDIRNWSVDAPTIGTLTVQFPDCTITITRVRGKSSENDLYYSETGLSGEIRGKDIKETQSLLNKYLGLDAETYIAGAYYNEFSPIGSFFTAKASERREILEKLTDLSLPKRLYERAANVRQTTKKAHVELSARLNKEIGRLEQIRESEAGVEAEIARWNENQARKLQELEAKSANFEMEKQSKIEKTTEKATVWTANQKRKIAVIQDELNTILYCKSVSYDVCPTCGSSEEYNSLTMTEMELSAKLKSYELSECPFNRELENQQKETNSYTIQLTQLKTTENPFVLQKNTIVPQKCTLEERVKTLMSEQTSLETKLMALEQLLDVSHTLRGCLLDNSIKLVESATNRYLETYFDSEFRVQFCVRSDDLDIEVQKSGITCNYRQLSKGQRGLLKLCFSVSVMQLVANNAGMHFSTLFFDEALDGLDSDLKLKAFNLFCELEKSHESVFVIDHNEELKQLFSNSIRVMLENNESRLIYE